jgi:ABC-type Fe3+ transport system permease subunit
MQAGEVLKILLLILLSSVKFIAGPPFAYSFNQKYEFSFAEAILYSIIGGMLGVFIFTFFSTQVSYLLHYLRQHGKRIIRRGVIFSRPEADVDVPLNIRYTYVEKEKDGQKKVLSGRYQKLLKVWKRYGLAGIAFITPCIISIPIGTIVANALEPNKRKIFAYMFASVVFWSIAIHSIFYLKIF